MSELTLKCDEPEQNIYEKYDVLKDKYATLYFATKQYLEAKKTLEDFMSDDENEIYYE